jgi:DNA gyrase/topoisomerase IV subunit B
MYISYLGSQGAFHLCKELINNAIDECINQNSPGKTISIFINESENTITISDDGRGIPLDEIVKVCSYLQAGSKFYRDYGTTAGENGKYAHYRHYGEYLLIAGNP